MDRGTHRAGQRWLAIVATTAVLAGFGALIGTSATPAAAAPAPPFVQVAAAANAACARTAAGVAYCWGQDANLQLGNGPDLTGHQESPGLVAAPTGAPGGVTWADITLGLSHGCGVTTTGAGYCWGLDYAGQLGTGPGEISEE